MTRRRLTGWTLALLIALTARLAPAMSVLPFDLAGLTERAGTIFVGHVERVDPGEDERGTPAIWTTFAVDQVLKGAPGDRYTLKQFSGPLDGTLFPSLPRFVPGESIVLFLHPVSELGFSSPVGIGQGCFRIRESDGRRVVENALGNSNLGIDATAGTRAASEPNTPARGPIPLETLLTRVRALVSSAP